MGIAETASSPVALLLGVVESETFSAVGFQVDDVVKDTPDMVPLASSTSVAATAF